MHIFRKKRLEPEIVTDLKIRVYEKEVRLDWTGKDGLLHNVWVPITAQRERRTYENQDTIETTERTIENKEK